MVGKAERVLEHENKQRQALAWDGRVMKIDGFVVLVC